MGLAQHKESRNIIYVVLCFRFVDVVSCVCFVKTEASEFIKASFGQIRVKCCRIQLKINNFDEKSYND